MTCWSVSVDAANAKQAEDGSIVALLKLILPFFTGSVAWSHWISLKFTFSISDKPALRMLSIFINSG